jgi:hypothetical protein
MATGTDTYLSQGGEFGYGTRGVLTVAEFRELVDGARRATPFPGATGAAPGRDGWRDGSRPPSPGR